MHAATMLLYPRGVLRDRNLVPLSHQHQHALALCVRLDRAMQAGELDLEAWQGEIQQIFEQEIDVHFAAEESALFPAAERFPELKTLVAELIVEHASLRELFAEATARSLQQEHLLRFIETLSHHIRKEERQLFEGLQKVMTSEDLAALGKALSQALSGAIKTCGIPNPATRLRAKK